MTISDVHLLELLVEFLRICDCKVVLCLQVVFVELNVVGTLRVDISIWLVFVIPLLWSQLVQRQSSDLSIRLLLLVG